MEVKIEAYDQFDSTPEIESFWRRNITPQSGYLYVHYNYDWISLWSRYILNSSAANSFRPLILAAFLNNRIVGIFPLMIARLQRRNLLPYRCLYFLGHGMVDHADIIIDSTLEGSIRDTVVRGFMNFLRDRRSMWDEARLHLIPEESQNWSMLSKLLREDNKWLFSSSPTANLYISTNSEPWNDFIARKGRDVTSDVRRRINKLNRMGRVELDCKSDAEIEILVSEFRDLHEQRQSVFGRDSIYGAKGNYQFIREILPIAMNRHELDYATLRLDGKLIAYMLGFQINRVRYSWNVAFDPMYDKFSPGKILMYRWIQDAFENPEIKEFNFMRGEAAFKLAWTDSARYTFRVRFFSSNYYSRTLRQCERLIRI